MQFEGSSDVMLCDQQRYLVCVERELIQPREEEVSLGAQIRTRTILTLLHCLYFSIDSKYMYGPIYIMYTYTLKL